MKTVKEFKMYELRNHEMKNLLGGYVGHLPPGSRYYEAHATNSTCTTMHIHTSESLTLTESWMRAWEAAGWSVSCYEKYVPLDGYGGNIYYC
jgi:hypothetical protein